MRRLPRPGDSALIVVLLLPLAVALPRLGGLGGPPELWLTWVGRVTGILGLAMMLLAGLVSCRVPGFDRPFGGLARLWRLHHWLGFAAFILVMVHILALGLAAVPASLDAAVATLFPPPSQGAIWLGWLAWVAMVVFLAPTFDFFGKPHYQRWKRLHLVSAVALLLGLWHALLLAGEAWPWWLLGIAGLGAIAWRKGVAPQRRHPYRIEQVVPLARGVVELVLRPEGGGIRHHAGQFVYLTPLDEGLVAGRGEEHPYTIASAPSDSRLRIGIKDLGDASHALQTVTPGTRALIEGPYGEFFERRFPQRDMLWLGGGIGITPFVGGARDLATGAVMEGHIHLFYLASDAVRAYYQEELVDIAERVEGFTFTQHYSREKGAMTEAYLRQYCPDFTEREIYICGPPGMNHHLNRLLLDQGIPASRIHSEVFDFL
ncbi:ferredoxin reductase family protein [Halomonas daqingensis]|uniref:Ferredoxin reductase family protein n=1 Tax=Billgrantia desiderata TaxID=52021 RepID=A0ABS9B3S6_9GAMM|nr:ferredoxin reductase family protein [Halomonas desiderata]MCE8042075.1 ferredoxin reductase family protein [Halomonas desiderata]MCE8046780.1 ferredoxin reductase family protein [Halomonas desiderata]